MRDYYTDQFLGGTDYANWMSLADSGKVKSCVDYDTSGRSAPSATAAPFVPSPPAPAPTPSYCPPNAKPFAGGSTYSTSSSDYTSSPVRSRNRFLENSFSDFRQSVHDELGRWFDSVPGWLANLFTLFVGVVGMVLLPAYVGEQNWFILGIGMLLGMMVPAITAAVLRFTVSNSIALVQSIIAATINLTIGLLRLTWALVKISAVISAVLAGLVATIKIAEAAGLV